MLLRRLSTTAVRGARSRAARPAALWRGLSSAAPESEKEEPAAAAAKPTKEAPPSPGGAEHSFQAETRSLLNIVSNALYTEREVFLRELLSNASDALEKCRQRRVANVDTADGDEELKIVVSVDAAAGTLTVEDSGIGMSEGDLATNLGTIALSGSKRFAAEAAESGGDASSIIGQFGVVCRA